MSSFEVNVIKLLDMHKQEMQKRKELEEENEILKSELHKIIIEKLESKGFGVEDVNIGNGVDLMLELNKLFRSE